MIVIPESELLLHSVFADETCITQHRYMALGCVVTDAADIVATDLLQFKESLGLRHEIKWEYVNRKNVDRYKRIVDRYFAHHNADRAHFHSLVIDTSKLDHRRYNDGDRELGFSKFVFQLLLKCSRLYGPKVKFHVELDARKTRHPLRPVRDMLNFKARNAFSMHHFPYRRLHFRDSKQSMLLQMSDILVGAVGFRTNGKERDTPLRLPKIMLSEHVRKQSGLATLSAQSNMKGRFTIWHMRLRGVTRA